MAKKRIGIKNRKIIRGGIAIYLLLLGLFIVIGYVISQTLILKSNPVSSENSAQLVCCDTGSGDACHPQTGDGQTLTYKGEEYGLLRTKTILLEGNVHLKDSGQTLNGDPIILNSSDTHIIPPQVATADCRTEAKDKYVRAIPPAPIILGSPQSVPYCVSIPDDQIIYVCRKNCFAATCSPEWTDEVTCYGDKESQYDAYFRLADVSSGIPDFVKNCDTKGLSTTDSSTSKQKIVFPTPEAGKKNLQLQTFKFISENSLVPWLSPFCKPAIYLYPTTPMPIHVEVKPIGPMMLTIPPYPDAGWDVTANSLGEITTQGKMFDYLYYEAKIPDERIEKPTNGYVVKNTDVKSKLEELLPQLGLNKKESQQFIEYWTNVLPTAPYYFIGIISMQNLDSISPLTIVPKPTTNIRVTLYFEALESQKVVSPPTIQAVQRIGYTMVEWGGIFKKNANYPFSCFQ